VSRWSSASGSPNLRDTPLVKRGILSNTNMDNASMDNAKLVDARLPRAELSGADLAGAILAGAAGVSCHQAEGGKKGAELLDDATMPNGQKYEGWLKGKEGCEELAFPWLLGATVLRDRRPVSYPPLRRRTRPGSPVR